jgi:hypothetical protein
MSVGIEIGLPRVVVLSVLLGITGVISRSNRYWSTLPTRPPRVTGYRRRPVDPLVVGVSQGRVHADHHYVERRSLFVGSAVSSNCSGDRKSRKQADYAGQTAKA